MLEKKMVAEEVPQNVKGETFLEKVETFLGVKETSTRKSTILNYPISLNGYLNHYIISL